MTSRTTAAADTVPPNSSEGEIGILGSLLLDCAHVMPKCVEAGVNEAWFFESRNAWIWTAINSMPPDHVDLLDEIKSGDKAVTVSDLVDTLRGMGATKEQGRTIYRRMVSDGLLVSWREPVLHGSTWLGTPTQIEERRALWQAGRQGKLPFSQERQASA